MKMIVSSRKIDYYVNDPYVTIIDIRLKEKFLHSHEDMKRQYIIDIIGLVDDIK